MNGADQKKKIKSILACDLWIPQIWERSVLEATQKAPVYSTAWGGAQLLLEPQKEYGSDVLAPALA